MAQQVLKDAYVAIGGTDMSSAVRSVSLSYSVEPQDDTAMGDTTRSRAAGLFDWSADINFYADEAANEPSRVLHTTLAAAAAITVEIKPAASATSTTNPLYSGSALLTGITPVDGEVGSMQMTRGSFIAAGALSRSTS